MAERRINPSTGVIEEKSDNLIADIFDPLNLFHDEWTPVNYSDDDDDDD